MRAHHQMLGHRLCAVGICELLLDSGGITAASAGSAPGGENTACLLPQLPHQPPENIVTTAVSPAERLCGVSLGSGCCYRFCASRREEAHPHLLRLLEASRLLACALPTLSSASSANSRATGLMNRISKTLV